MILSWVKQQIHGYLWQIIHIQHMLLWTCWSSPFWMIILGQSKLPNFKQFPWQRRCFTMDVFPRPQGMPTILSVIISCGFILRYMIVVSLPSRIVEEIFASDPEWWLYLEGYMIYIYVYTIFPSDISKYLVKNIIHPLLLTKDILHWLIGSLS